MIHTNRCKHCNKTKEEHILSIYCAPIAEYRFCDSGLSSLDAHKEELYEAICDFVTGVNQFGVASWGAKGAIDKLNSILNQIEKEK